MAELLGLILPNRGKVEAEEALGEVTGELGEASGEEEEVSGGAGEVTEEETEGVEAVTGEEEEDIITIDNDLNYYIINYYYNNINT